MVSSITKLVLIGAGIAIAVGLVYIQYQFQTGQSHESQIARARLGQGEAPKVGRERLIDTLDEILKKYNSTGPPISIRDILNNNTRANAVAYYDLAAEEQKYEPWALR
jgi:hypothetical protein